MKSFLKPKHQRESLPLRLCMDYLAISLSLIFKCPGVQVGLKPIMRFSYELHSSKGSFYCGKMFSTQPSIWHSLKIEKNLEILRPQSCMHIGNIHGKQDSWFNPTMIRLTNGSCHSISPSSAINMYFVPFWEQSIFWPFHPFPVLSLLFPPCLSSVKLALEFCLAVGVRDEVLPPGYLFVCFVPLSSLARCHYLSCWELGKPRTVQPESASSIPCHYYSLIKSSTFARDKVPVRASMMNSD